MSAAMAVVLCAVLAGCQWPPNTRYVNSVFATVDATTNVLYRTTTDFHGSTIDLRLDIYQPHGDTATKRPAVMWMFGGAWVQGSKNDMTAYATDSAKRGYVGVSIAYRIRPGGTDDIAGAAWDAYDDAIAAIEWLKANAATYRIDPTTIIAAGYSAGAINALNVVFAPGSRPPATTPAAGAIAIAGVSMRTPTAGKPPVIMHHGTADNIVPYSSGQNTCNKANSVGDLCKFVSYPGGTHYIASGNATEIRDSSALFAFEEILRKHGYVQETVS
jgi:acetyl esterase/lipase